jgi:hypothetical protein
MEMLSNSNIINELPLIYNSQNLILAYNSNKKTLLVGKSPSLTNLEGVLIII